ncbi:cytochrome c/FTR1 family iron permease [Sphingomonas sp. ASV193]|uniref:cytochrome c/FTR1 family iron permease n=1 Tax=Sphingomonas sp. ASV193 TaxID=3144405 RepID=UPI0032E8F7C6
MRMLFDLLRLAALILFASLTAPTFADTPNTSSTIQTSWRLLDYVAVDYPGAVRDGRVLSASEFAEMREFTATAEAQLKTLHGSPSQSALLTQAAALRAQVDAKAPATEIARRARQLGADLLKAYPVPFAPAQMPDLNRGNQLYQANCASCHGVAGHGDGPAAASLDPKPVNFTDRNRASERSLFALEQVIDQGIGGTPMPSFAHLPAQDRWNLAFKVGTFAYPADLVAAGKQTWEGDPVLRARIPSLAALATLTPAALSQQIGEDKAIAVIAYLRSTPSAIQPSSGDSLALTRSKLAASVSAYAAGQRDDARKLALSAYLDGFEPVEPILTARDPALMHRIESSLGEYRAAIGQGAPVADIQARAQALDGQFAAAEQALAPQASSAVSTFLSALTILVREGVEALLIVVAMIAFLRKAERTDELRYVHGGWVAALAAGLLTWFVATTLISFSGASRELTEGFGGVFAALVLVFVGIWMHGKAQADAWQRYVRDKLNRALNERSGWFLFALAFIVVYREAFETILFYAAMWEDSPRALLAGVGVGAALLAGIAWAMLRYSAKLPIAQFFRYSSILMAVLAVVLAGKGIAALQEAGLLGVTPLANVPRIDWVGLQPSLQVVLAQLAAFLALVVGFNMNRRPRSPLAT